jgi:hypothetical protein
LKLAGRTKERRAASNLGFTSGSSVSPRSSARAPLAPARPVATNQQPAAIEESASSGSLSPELKLAVAFKLLHCFELAEQNRSLSAEELNLIKWLCMCHPYRGRVCAGCCRCRAVCSFFSGMRGRGAAVRHRLTPTVAVDPLAEAVELLAVGVMMPFTVKPPDIRDSSPSSKHSEGNPEGHLSGPSPREGC